MGWSNRLEVEVEQTATHYTVETWRPTCGLRRPAARQKSYSFVRYLTKCVFRHARTCWSRLGLYCWLRQHGLETSRQTKRDFMYLTPCSTWTRHEEKPCNARRNLRKGSKSQHGVARLRSSFRACIFSLYAHVPRLDVPLSPFPRSHDEDGPSQANQPEKQTNGNELVESYRFFIYRVSLSSLFILAILPETLRSMVRSPISTTSPPTMSGLTYLDTS